MTTTQDDPATCSTCSAPLGIALYSGAYPGGHFDAQTDAWYCSAGCAEAARGSQTITISRREDR